MNTFFKATNVVVRCVPAGKEVKDGFVRVDRGSMQLQRLHNGRDFLMFYDRNDKEVFHIPCRIINCISHKVVRSSDGNVRKGRTTVFVSEEVDETRGHEYYVVYMSTEAQEAFRLLCDPKESQE